MTLARIGATELLYRDRGAITGRVLELGVGGDPYAQLWRADVTLDRDVKHRPTVAGDAHGCPFRSAAFDTVIASQVFEHVRSPWLVAQEVARILKPGGLLIVAVPFLYGLHEQPHDYFRYTEWGLRRLFEEDFSIESLQPYGCRAAVAWDILTTMTRSSSVLRRALFVARRRMSPNQSRGRRSPRLAALLLRAEPGEHPLGYVVRARRKPGGD